MKWIQTSKNINIKTFLFNIYKVDFKSESSGKEGIFDEMEEALIKLASFNEVESLST